MKQTFFLLFLFPFLTYGQDCDCKSIFEWTKKTFEENDAGFQYIMGKKGEQAYALHNQKVIEKISNIKEPAECTRTIKEWLKFFRKGHIDFFYTGKPSENSTDNEPIEKKKTDEFKDWETYSTNLEKFKKDLDQKSIHNFEGIWQTGYYQIGIKKEGNNYIGFIVDSETEVWKKDQVKLKISTQGDQFNSIFYMFNRSAEESQNVKLFGINNLQVGDIFLTRTYPKIKDDSPYQLHFDGLTAELPFLKELNSTTLYFRIPSFSGTPEKTAIDSVIAINKEKILSTENLIIDIRNGTGGFDDAYYEILPLIYTNPIRSPGAEFLSTPLNNQRMLDFINFKGIALEFNLKFDEEQKQEFREGYEKLSKHLGAFVDLDTISVGIRTYDTIYSFPKNVGIIQNENNVSTDEQFILAAKQSKKVKLFGRTTFGALDVSNLNIVKSPCQGYNLVYALSKSSRIPHMAIDDIGIQPDYYIDPEIPAYEWINFVNKILNE
ncbi:MAG: S41 family peptidase [Saprospiraceae bacterium]